MKVDTQPARLGWLVLISLVLHRNPLDDFGPINLCPDRHPRR